MTDTVYKYQIYCVTEQIFVEGWGPSKPVACYNNNTHSVNLQSVQELDKVSNGIVTIKEDKSDIARNMKVDCINIENVPFGESQTINKSFPFPVSLYSFQFVAAEENRGDEFSIIANPDVTLGLIASNITAGATSFTAPPALIAYGSRGFSIRFTDGVNTTNLHDIININKETNVVTFQTPCEFSFSSTNTLVKMTILVLDKLRIGANGVHAFGGDIIGGAYIPANTNTRYVYTNRSTSGEPKNLSLYLTYLY